MRRELFGLWIGAMVHSASGAAGNGLPWKLTVGEYAYADYYGSDVNLRWRADDTGAWAGLYHDRIFGTQSRAGADTSIGIGKYLQLQPSMQVASRGFVGGSVNMVAGGAWYGSRVSDEPTRGRISI